MLDGIQIQFYILLTRDGWIIRWNTNTILYFINKRWPDYASPSHKYEPGMRLLEYTRRYTEMH